VHRVAGKLEGLRKVARRNITFAPILELDDRLEGLPLALVENY